MKLWITMAWVCVGGLLWSCKTATDQSRLHTQAFVPESYAELGASKVLAAYLSLNEELLRFQAQPGAEEAHQVAEAVKHVRIALDIFVHSFPLATDHDPLEAIKSELEEGERLFHAPSRSQAAAGLTDSRRRAAQEWSERYRNPVRQERLKAYFGSMNRSRATKRPKREEASFCWTGVDFIPDLGAPASEGLHDFIKAMLRTLPGYQLKAAELSDLLQRSKAKPFYELRDRLHSIEAVVHYLPLAGTKAEALVVSLQRVALLATELNQLSAMIEAHARLVGEGEIQQARALAEKIATQWGQQKSRLNEATKF